MRWYLRTLINRRLVPVVMESGDDTRSSQIIREGIHSGSQTSRIRSGGPVTLSCAGTVLRGLVAAFPHAARLDALELLLEEGVADERDSSAGGAPHVQDGRMRDL